jgi:hypothetical protein
LLSYSQCDHDVIIHDVKKKRIYNMAGLRRQK